MKLSQIEYLILFTVVTYLWYRPKYISSPSRDSTDVTSGHVDSIMELGKPMAEDPEFFSRKV